MAHAHRTDQCRVCNRVLRTCRCIGPKDIWWTTCSACLAKPAQPQPKTIRVRIAVAVGDDGKWCATGDWEYSDEMNGNEATESLRRQIGYPEHGVMVHFIEATVPLPESVVVEGEVVK